MAYDQHTADILAENEVLRAENRRMRDALLALDGVTICGAHNAPGIGHEAFWAIVRRGLGSEEQA